MSFLPILHAPVSSCTHPLHVLANVQGKSGVWPLRAKYIAKQAAQREKGEKLGKNCRGLTNRCGRNF
jgi:hypothetical protein